MSTMRGLQAKFTLANGTAVIKSNMNGMQIPFSIGVVPAAGDTVTVSLSFDNGTTYPQSWALTAADQIIVSASVTNVKAQRTAGAGTTSVVSIC